MERNLGNFEIKNEALFKVAKLDIFENVGCKN